MISLPTCVDDLSAPAKALGAVHVLSAVASAKQYASSDTTFSMTPFPATDNADDTRLPVAVGISYAGNAHAKQPELAREFIKFLASEEGQNIYATKAAAAPALPNASFKADSLQQPVLAGQQAGTTTVYPDQNWPNPKVQQEHLTAVQELFSGQINVSTVLSRMDAAFKEKD